MKGNLAKIKVLTVCAVIFIVLLFSALIINLIKYSTASARMRDLKNELTALNTQIAENDDELEYKNSQDYIERYAREHLGRKKKGDKIIIGN